jgi:hypothetical protein
METKYCKRCKTTKELSLFYKTREYKGTSYYSCCKSCWDKRTIENRSKASMAAPKNLAPVEISTLPFQDDDWPIK